MSVTLNDVKNAIKKLAEVVIENEVYFCELDSVAGDGDFGMSLSKGFREVLANWDTIEADDIGAFVKECALIITEYCGGASGPIWGSAFRGASKVANGKLEISFEEIGNMFREAVNAIQKRGGAKLGDKTLLDALIPATEAIEKTASEGKSAKEILEAASEAATKGAESTKEIVATKGRATYVGERSINHPDAGAVAISVILKSYL